MMPHKPYSPTEAKILKILPKDGKKIGTDKIAERFYAKRTMPDHGRIYIASAMRSLIKKTKINRESFKICRTPVGGPRRIEYWIE